MLNYKNCSLSHLGSLSLSPGCRFILLSSLSQSGLLSVLQSVWILLLLLLSFASREFVWSVLSCLSSSWWRGSQVTHVCPQVWFIMLAYSVVTTTTACRSVLEAGIPAFKKINKNKCVLKVSLWGSVSYLNQRSGDGGCCKLCGVSIRLPF